MVYYFFSLGKRSLPCRLIGDGHYKTEARHYHCPICIESKCFSRRNDLERHIDTGHINVDFAVNREANISTVTPLVTEQVLCKVNYLHTLYTVLCLYYFIGFIVVYQKCLALCARKSKGTDVPTMFFMRGSPVSSENHISGLVYIYSQLLNKRATHAY